VSLPESKIGGRCPLTHAGIDAVAGGTWTPKPRVPDTAGAMDERDGLWSLGRRHLPLSMPNVQRPRSAGAGAERNERWGASTFILVSGEVGDETPGRHEGRRRRVNLFKGTSTVCARQVEREMRGERGRTASKQSRITKTSCTVRDSQLANAERLARIGAWRSGPA